MSLIAVEHPSVQFVKRGIATLGVIDSQYTLVGLTDVRSTDHVRGDRSSPIALIEYSDFECLMCAAMQDTLDRLVTEKPVMLVSRHLFPDTAKQSFDLAVAAECVGKHGGDEAYTAFAKYLYDDRHDQGTDRAIEQKVASLGVSLQDFQSCVIRDSVIHNKVREDSKEGWQLGAQGTPYIVVVYNGRPIGISYANNYDDFLSRITALVAEVR